MNKLFTCACLLIMISCATIKKIDTTGFHSVNQTVYFNEDSVATLSNIEYSIDNGKHVKEMTFRLINLKHADKVDNLLYYIHQRHKKWEIEIDYPISNFKLN